MIPATWAASAGASSGRPVPGTGAIRPHPRGHPRQRRHPSRRCARPPAAHPCAAWGLPRWSRVPGRSRSSSSASSTWGPGLLAVAAFTGWVTGVAVVDLAGGAGLRAGAWRVAVAVVLASGAILAAIAADWAWAQVQGGVLGPLDYAWQRYGPAAILDVGVAGILAGLHAR